MKKKPTPEQLHAFKEKVKLDCNLNDGGVYIALANIADMSVSGVQRYFAAEGVLSHRSCPGGLWKLWNICLGYLTIDDVFEGWSLK